MCDEYGYFETGLCETIQKVKKTLNTFALISAIIGFGYLVFWGGAVNDSYFLELGAGIFNPIANLLYPLDTTVDVYRNTGFTLLLAIIPVTMINYMLDKIRDVLINIEMKRENEIIEKDKLEQKKAYMARFDGIRMYSICLSLDYESKKGVKDEDKNKLNNTIYSKIKTTLKTIDNESFVSQSDVFILSSANFRKYDLVYEKMLSTLSQVKKVVKEKYDIDLIASVTTDAYSEDFKLNNVRKNHFEIQSFNFKNRALSTAKFANKYKHLKHNKYAGIPIGEYAYFKEGVSDNTYELNVIHKNLNQTLSQ